MTRPKPRFGGAATAGCVEVSSILEELLVAGLGVRWRQRFFGPRVQRFCAEGGTIEVGANRYDALLAFTVSLYAEGLPAGSMRLTPRNGGLDVRPGRAPAPLHEVSDEELDELDASCPDCEACAGPLADPEPLVGHTFKVAWVSVPVEFRMRGYGLVMYELAWYLASALGCYLCSDSERSAFAERVWSGFARKGFVLPVATGYTGVLYAAPHEALYLTARDVENRNLPIEGVEETLALVAVLERDIDELKDARHSEGISDEEYEALDDRISDLTEEVSRVWWALLEPYNEQVHRMNMSLTFPPLTDDGDYLTIPPGGAVDITDHESWWPREPLEVGISWPCSYYVMHPVQHTHAATRGMFGLGRALEQPTLPDDDAADFG